MQTCFGPASPILFFNDSGDVNGEIFYQIMAHFTCVWREQFPGLHCCLLGDNLGVHKDQDIMKMALLSDVYMLYLPAGTTQWSQPLDNLLFACLKQGVKKES